MLSHLKQYLYVKKTYLRIRHFSGFHDDDRSKSRIYWFNSKWIDFLIDSMLPLLFNYLKVIIWAKTISFRCFQFGWIYRPRLIFRNQLSEIFCLVFSWAGASQLSEIFFAAKGYTLDPWQLTASGDWLK